MNVNKTCNRFGVHDVQVYLGVTDSSKSGQFCTVSQTMLMLLNLIPIARGRGQLQPYFYTAKNY